MNELSFDANIHRHAHKYAGRSGETAGHRRGLTDVSRDSDWDQIEATDATIRRIECDPACAWHVDFRPGMGRSSACGPNNVLIRIVEIPGYDPRPETETARRFGEQDREIPARPPAAIQGLRRRLRAFVLPALIADLI